MNLLIKGDLPDMEIGSNGVVPVYGSNPDNTIPDENDPIPTKERGYYFHGNQFI